jgi:ribonucleoside-diphosphate reductase alpha chain
MTLMVTKRDGSKEPLDLEKLHKVTEWACEGIAGVSASEIEIRSQIQFYTGIKTTDIQETMIKSAADLISVDNPGYQYVAGRLINYHLRKQVYGKPEPIGLWQHFHNVVEKGYYDGLLSEKYTMREFTELSDYIDHDRDFDIVYAGMEQFRGKYLIRNRVNGEIYETPNTAMMLIAMWFFHDEPNVKERLRLVKDFYDLVSTFVVSLPTPIMAGLRTPQRQFSSCVLIETDDSLDSMNATTSAIVKYVSQRAGIGIGAGRIRAIGSPIRNGDTSHTGVIPFYRMFQAAVRSCSQGAVRNGAATLYYPLWHLEIEDLLVLKNNKGTEDNRIRHMDYCVQFNRLMYERLISDGDITLFSPHDVKDMYDAFFTDYGLFKELYEKAEKNTKLRKKTVKASDLFSAFIQERKDTGRIYLMNVDHANDHSSFLSDAAPIRQSNLCCEITLPTKPITSIGDDTGEIALCTLAAINWGAIRKPEDFEKPARLLVRALDNLLTFQNYPIIAAARATAHRRPLGIGIINLAYWMADKGFTYQDITPEQLFVVHQYAEAWSYYLIKASMELCRDHGRDYYGGMKLDTKYSQGVLPIDTYKKEIDELVPSMYYDMDWDQLRSDLKKHGIRNSTLMALMPAETSAQVSNSTNGIEPARQLITVKQSKDGVLKQVVPKVGKLKKKYDLLWDQKSPEGYLKICAVLQKFVDQAISVNTSYNPRFYPDEQIPMSELLRHVLMFYRYGGKNLYYFNTADNAGEYEIKPASVSEDLPEADCESCKI